MNKTHRVNVPLYSPISSKKGLTSQYNFYQNLSGFKKGIDDKRMLKTHRINQKSNINTNDMLQKLEQLDN